MPSDELDTVLTAPDSLGDDKPPPAGQLQMVVIGSGTFATHPLPDASEVVIGRSNQADIVIDDASISRRHARLIIPAGDAPSGSITIEDLESANGVVVGRSKIEPHRPVAIAVGELVKLGNVNILLQQRTRAMRARRLWTHDYFEGRLEEEFAREARAGASFAVLRLRVDRRAPAAYVEEALCALVRESDILGKLGPYEYEVLMPDTVPVKANEEVERLEQQLAERKLSCKTALACCPRDGRRMHQLLARLEAPSAASRTSAPSEQIVVDPQMQSLYRLVEQVAVSNISVLLLGETGVGKAVFAQALHRSSPRSSGPFVEVNCAAFTETLLESELFGHEKGAFTSAEAAKPGLIELAHGGTLFLDEIGDMPLGTQVKLLRVLESSQLRRVGALAAKPIDVRFVAATNSDLEGQVASGGFRRDLFYRLNGVTIVIPPLRDRRTELAPLAETFVRRAWTRSSPPPKLAHDTLELMANYGWPGNVRELRHMMERAILLCDGGPIKPEHLPLERMRSIHLTPSTPARSSPVGALAPAIKRGTAEERAAILQALETANGNQTAAARLLGISRRTLINRLNEYELDRPRKDTTKLPKM